MRHRNRWFAVLAVLLAAALTACGSSGTKEETKNEPASVEAVEGSTVSQVTLTKEAADRIGLKTERVKPSEVLAAAGQSAHGAAKVSRTTVPLAAVLYDEDGASWVYTNPKPLTYVRQRVDIEKVLGDSAVLRSGPAPGTLVVTVGAAELLGTEYVVEGE
jgi:hypothetical protein